LAKPTKRNIQQRLERELESLKVKLSLNEGLSVVWKPTPSKDVSGEVKGRTIYVYENCEGKALDTLRHEVLDYCVSQAIEPYKEVTNRLIKMINDDAYKRKERIVEKLKSLLEDGE